MLIKKLKKLPMSKKYYATQKITSDSITSTMQSASSLGYYKDGFLSNWLSFRTIKEATQALHHNNEHTQDSARRFFFECIKEKQDLEAIADIAERTFTLEKTHDLGRTKESALQLFTALAECDHVHPTALKYAATGTLTARGRGNISWASRKLFEVLFQKNHSQAVDVAIETATQAFSHYDWRTRHDGLELFKIILNHGKGFQEASQIAVDRVKDKSNWQITLSDTFQLLIDLVEKNQNYEQGYEVATTVAMQFYTSEYHDVQKSSLWLLMALVKKNQSVEQAMQVAEDKIGSDTECVRKLAYELKLLCLEKIKESKPKKVKFGPLEDLGFVPSTELKRPNVKPEPWSFEGKKEYISTEAAIAGIKELEERHKYCIDHFDRE